jgi:hypothetical protein
MKTNYIQKIKLALSGSAPKGAIALLMGFLIMVLPVSSCKKPFLDVVPDNVSTIANAFVSKAEAEKYLFTCYSYLPTGADPTYNVGLTAGDEVWVEDPANHIRSTNVLQLPRGFQNSSDPIANYMNGTRDAAGKLPRHTRL